MDGIVERKVEVNGIKMKVAEKGDGPTVLLLHGFPELWYSWRHQILSLSSIGYRAVAPDLRGYGDTDAPPSSAHYTVMHIVGDLIALLDSLAGDSPPADKAVFVVGHDWGANIAWYLSLFRPDRVRAMVILSVAFRPRNPDIAPLNAMRSFYGPDFYICRFQKEGEIEAEFEKIGTEKVLRYLLTYRDPNPLCIPEGFDFGDSPTTLPSWLSEGDLEYYVSRYKQTGFTGPLNYYRSIDRNWELTRAWGGGRVEAPVKFIVGDQDLSYHMKGVKEYIHGGGLKREVPLLEDVVVLPGAAHFINQERAQEVTTHIHDFFSKFITFPIHKL